MYMQNFTYKHNKVFAKTPQTLATVERERVSNPVFSSTNYYKNHPVYFMLQTCFAANILFCRFYTNNFYVKIYKRKPKSLNRVGIIKILFYYEKSFYYFWYYDYLINDYCIIMHKRV